MISPKRLAWNILGTLFLLLLSSYFLWNYYARQTETPTANQMIATLFKSRIATYEAEDAKCGESGVRFSDTASGVIARENKAPNEIFVCGPYENFFPGKYEVTFRVRAETSIAGSVHFDVASDKGKRILGATDIPDSEHSSSYKDITLPFETGINSGLEFRVASPEAGKILVDTISVTQKEKSLIPVFKMLWNILKSL